MGSYTEECEQRIGDLTPDDENFTEELLDVAKSFRPFSEALDVFLKDHGYSGDLSDIQGKISFLRTRFVEAGMKPPRQVMEWYLQGQPIRRKTAFLLIFAFGLMMT